MMFPPVDPISRARWRLDGEGSPYEIPEHIISTVMRRKELVRIDLLGEAPGMWSLHPVFRTEAYYRELPGLIDRIESGDMPEEQLGDYDVVDTLVDTSRERAERFCSEYGFQAAHSLARLGRAEAIPPLVEVLRFDNKYVRLRAAAVTT